jgi:hypothetical protein
MDLIQHGESWLLVTLQVIAICILRNLDDPDLRSGIVTLASWQPAHEPFLINYKPSIVKPLLVFGCASQLFNSYSPYSCWVATAIEGLRNSDACYFAIRR